MDRDKMSKKILISCILAVVVIVSVLFGISSCGRNGRMTSITVLPNGPHMIAGTSLPLQAQGLLSDGTTFFLAVVDWSLVSAGGTSIVTIDPVLGVVTAPEFPYTGFPSTYVIKASDPYSVFTGTTLLSVDPLSSITVTPYSPSMLLGQTHQFLATGYLNSSDTTTTPTQDLTTFVAWATSPSDTTVATIVNTPGVAGTGIITLGTVTGTVIIQATDPISGITGSTLLTITSVPLSSLSITPSPPAPISMTTTTTQSFSVLGTYLDQSTREWTLSAFWTSSNTAVATIDPFDPAALDAAGIHLITVTAVAPGTTSIVATDPITGVATSTVPTVTP
jgi:trimeric autotransporter adhesin